jgi:hypothetical protein
MRAHECELPDSPLKPPNELLSQKSNGEGAFDFDGVLDDEDGDCKDEFTPASICSDAEHSDVDSFYKSKTSLGTAVEYRPVWVSRL